MKKFKKFAKKLGFKKYLTEFKKPDGMYSGKPVYAQSWKQAQLIADERDPKKK